MNDLDLIAQIRPDAPLAGADDLLPARDKLLAALAVAAQGDGRGAAGGSRVGQRARPGWRLTLAGTAIAAAAAGIAIALTLGSAVPPAPATAHGHRSPASRRAPGPGSRVVTLPATLTAAAFLRDGATALRRRAFTPPQPDQYVYAETEGPHGTSRYQIWQSVDGRRAGLIKPVGTSPVPMPPCPVAQAESGACSLSAGYLPQLPTSPKAAFDFLVRIGYATTSAAHKPIKNWAANDLGKSVVTILQDEYLSPAQQAALFDLMAHTAGFRVVRHAVDAIGRTGVGISWKYEGLTAVIVIDPASYAFLGTSLTYRGHSVANWALVAKQIVDSVPAYHAPKPRPASAPSGG